VSSAEVEKMLRDIRQLPSLSVVVLEILDSFKDEGLKIPELVRKIGRDQGLAARVLRVANSAFLGFPSKVASINEAVVVLGFHTVRSLALAAGVIQQFPPGEGNRAFDRLAFWQHAIGVGVAARVLAQKLGRNQEEAFTAGLLHDIGRLVLDAYFHDSFLGILSRAGEEDCLLVSAEKKVLGLDHAEIGYEVARQWKFPLPVQLAIRGHHNPDAPSSELADLVHFANVLAHGLEIGNSGYDQVPPLAAGAWRRLGLEWNAVAACLPEIERLNAGATLLVAESA
jgi:putative nucleotidyltransferase with HDIG domain